MKKFIVFVIYFTTLHGMHEGIEINIDTDLQRLPSLELLPDDAKSDEAQAQKIKTLTNTTCDTALICAALNSLRTQDHQQYQKIYSACNQTRVLSTFCHAATPYMASAQSAMARQANHAVANHLAMNRVKEDEIEQHESDRYLLHQFVITTLQKDREEQRMKAEKQAAELDAQKKEIELRDKTIEIKEREVRCRNWTNAITAALGIISTTLVAVLNKGS